MAHHPYTKLGLGELQRSLERFENYNDGFILPETLLVLRLDAHRIGAWDQAANSQYPTGPRLTAAFHGCATALMASSLRIVCAFCHGDEINLFVDPVENQSPLRRSRIISVLSSAAALHFAEASKLTATFEARLAELPSFDRVVQYFYWQRKYCARNALTIALRDAMKRQGLSNTQIEAALHGVTEEARLAKLKEFGEDFNSIPKTTRYGALFWWQREERDGREHFRICSVTDLPDQDDEFIELVSRVVKGKSLVIENSTQAATVPDTGTPKGTAPTTRRGSRKSNTLIFKSAPNNPGRSATE